MPRRGASSLQAESESATMGVAPHSYYTTKQDQE